MSVGPWMDDGGIVERPSATMTSGASHVPGTGVGYLSTYEGGAIDFAAAWSGAGTVTRFETTNANVNEQAMLGYRYPIADPAAPFEHGADWRVTWFTLSRANVPTVTTGVLPDTVVDGDGNFLDPNVTGVEWEPTDQPFGQYVQGFRKLSGSLLGTHASVKVWQANDATPGVAVDPGFRTGSQVASLPTLATLTGAGSAWFNAANPAGLPLTGPATLVVAALDSWTESATAPSTPPNSGVTWAELQSLSLYSQYRPRYRLLYGASLAPPLRQYPRNDGLAGSVRRLYPPPRSTQRSNRRAGGYL